MNIPKVLLAADNDRDMLEYLHEAFQSQVNVCDQCGHEEPTSTCDSALDLNAYLGHFTTPPQPIYDEAKERELFAEFSRRIVAHDAANFPIRWCDCVPDEEIEEHLNTWLACAKSRAKGVEAGHE